MNLISIVKETGEIIGVIRNGHPYTEFDAKIKLNLNDILEVTSNKNPHLFRLKVSEGVHNSCEGCILQRYTKGLNLSINEAMNLCKVCIRSNVDSSLILIKDDEKTEDNSNIKEFVDKDTVRKVICNEDTCPYYESDLSCQSPDLECLYLKLLGR